MKFIFETNILNHEIILNILLSGLGGAIFATLIVIIHNKCKEVKKEKNLFKGLISEMRVNLEYITHNYKLSTQFLNNKTNSDIFLNVRNVLCIEILTSGNIQLKNETRKNLEHYLVTLDRLNHLVRRTELEKIDSNEFERIVKKIKRYCRDENSEFGEKNDYIKKHIFKIKKDLVQQKNYLAKNIF